MSADTILIRVRADDPISAARGTALTLVIEDRPARSGDLAWHGADAEPRLSRPGDNDAPAGLPVVEVCFLSRAGEVEHGHRWPER
jgi:hypothetical protein